MTLAFIIFISVFGHDLTADLATSRRTHSHLKQKDTLSSQGEGHILLSRRRHSPQAEGDKQNKASQSETRKAAQAKGRHASQQEGEEGTQGRQR